jgi:hypothetical protein
VLYRPKQVPNSGDAYGVRVTFRLDHNLAAADRIRVKGDRVYPSVPAQRCGIWRCGTGDAGQRCGTDEITPR